MPPLFEYDEAKSGANLAKHGIDFSDAQALWADDRRYEAPIPVAHGEERWQVIGVIDGKHWTAIVTFRDDATRIISVRRSREREKRAYGDQDDQR